MSRVVVPFRNYKLHDIPEALRLLAHQIETGTTKCRHVVVVMQVEGDAPGDAVCDYRAFGVDFSRAHAVGLLAYAQREIMG